MRLAYAILASVFLWTQTKTSAHVEGGNIYCLPKDGAPAFRVSSDSGNVTGPAWNPDGSQTLYVATGTDEAGHDYEKAWFTIVNLADLETRNLELPPGLLGVRSPAWSPDGTRVAFVARPVTTPGIAYTDLYIMNLSDGTTVNFTNGSISFIGMPTWSPDGTEIIFVLNRDGDMEIFRTAADGSAVTQVTANEGTGHGAGVVVRRKDLLCFGSRGARGGTGCAVTLWKAAAGAGELPVIPRELVFRKLDEGFPAAFAQLFQGAVAQLPDPFAGDAQAAADLLEGHRRQVAEPVVVADNPVLALVEDLEAVGDPAFRLALVQGLVGPLLVRPDHGVEGRVLVGGRRERRRRGPAAKSAWRFASAPS